MVTIGEVFGIVVSFLRTVRSVLHRRVARIDEAEAILPGHNYLRPREIGDILHERIARLVVFPPKAPPETSR